VVESRPNRESPKPIDAAARVWLELTDAQLLTQCQVDTYRASGPGGQKRNKTSSAVRLRHGATGTIVTATESRSQRENRTRALRRLRESIALNQRSQIDPDTEAPAFLIQARQRGPGLRVSQRHPDYFKIIQYILDLLLACRGSISEAAARLGLSTAQFIRFLRRDPGLWGHVNRLRQDHGHHPLI